MVPNEIKQYVRGSYGKSPAPIKDDIKHKIIGDEEIFTGRPADFLFPSRMAIEKDRCRLSVFPSSHQKVE